jgi:hypothetical protein
VYLRGILEDFLPKTVPRIVILKSGLFRGFFSVWVGNPVRERNPPDSKDPRISKLKGYLRRIQTFF